MGAAGVRTIEMLAVLLLYKCVQSPTRLLVLLIGGASLCLYIVLPGAAMTSRAPLSSADFPQGRHVGPLRAARRQARRGPGPPAHRSRTRAAAGTFGDAAPGAGGRGGRGEACARVRGRGGGRIASAYCGWRCAEGEAWGVASVRAMKRCGALAGVEVAHEARRRSWASCA